MMRFSVAYTLKGKAGLREVSAPDEAAARIIFFNLGDIVFTGAVIKTVTQLAEDRSAAALPERLTKRKVGRLPAPGWREEEAALASQIENRADAKQEAIRREVWDEADRLQEEIRQLSIKREKLVRDNGPGRAV